MELRSLAGVLVAVSVAGYSGGAAAEEQMEGPQPRQLYSKAEASGLAPRAAPTVMRVKIERVAAVAEDDGGPARGVSRIRDEAAPERHPNRAGHWQGVVPAARVGEREASKLIGASAFSSQGEELGEISGLVRSPVTNTLQAVVDVGGFLGVGERLVALPLQQGRIDPQGNLRISVSRRLLEEMRAYEPPRSTP
jgi:hypothetical protein